MCQNQRFFGIVIPMFVPVKPERHAIPPPLGIPSLSLTIMHGGSPKGSKPLDIDMIEELVRRGLRKAVSLDGGRKLREPRYWESLILSGSNPP